MIGSSEELALQTTEKVVSNATQTEKLVTL